jgi:hypothetical protein
MKLRYKILLSLLLALGLGLGSAYWALKISTAKTWQTNGGWQYHPGIGSQSADMYTRALVAWVGLFALNKTETIYYTTNRDQDGQTLTSSLDYRIEGRDLGARWWSITLYGHDYYLVANQENRHSYNMANLVREADGSFIIRVSRTPKPGNWLPSGNEEVFDLTLRLYNPDKNVYDHPGGVELPRVIRE